MRQEDVSKTERQKLAARRWVEAKYRGTLEAATGFGKTRVAQMISEKMQDKWGPRRILVVVPSLFLEAQWNKELREYNIVNFQVVVINTLIESYWQCDFLILDEIHEYSGPRFREVFSRVSYKQILGLTATMGERDERYDIIAAHCPVFDTIPLSVCREKGWVSEFGVYNLGIELPPSEQMLLKKHNKTFNDNFKWFGWDFNLAMKCGRDIREATRHARKLGWTKDGKDDYGTVMGVAQKWSRAMQKRKKLLYETEAKVETVIKIVRKAQDKRIIVFSQSTYMADRIAEALNDEFGMCCVSYHSKVKGEDRPKTPNEIKNSPRSKKTKRIGAKKIKEERLSAFVDESSNIHILSTALALDRGADLPFIDMEIITSGSSKFRQAIQRLGRGIRALLGKVTVVIEVYVRSIEGCKSQDEVWLEERQREIPADTISWVTTIEEIGL